MTARHLPVSLIAITALLFGCRGAFESGAVLESPSDDPVFESDDDDAGVEADAPDGDEPPVGDPGKDLPPPDPDLDIQLGSNADFPDFLTDGKGRALYMFTGDVLGTNTTRCINACVEEFPAFDANVQQVGDGLSLEDFGRFHRVDGTWQITYKGRPLYHFSGDEGRSVAGDGVREQFFVARNYFIFLRSDPEVSPWGQAVASRNTPFLTDENGRSLYAYLATPAPAPGEPMKVCTGDCLLMWPEWAPEGELRGRAIPSVIARGNFRARLGDTDSVPQLEYLGYPLHYNVGDDTPGEIHGHNIGEWRLVAPTRFE